jgi:hypothetical protein
MTDGILIWLFGATIITGCIVHTIRKGEIRPLLGPVIRRSVSPVRYWILASIFVAAMLYMDLSMFPPFLRH